MVKPHSPQNSGFELQPPEPLEQQPSRRYSYVSILEMTNHFETLLGEGGFGKVYYGLIGNTEVAVKILSAKSAQGYREFQSEACCFNNTITFFHPLWHFFYLMLLNTLRKIMAG